jgi:tetratricopeptide (TPR) repeat protein
VQRGQRAGWRNLEDRPSAEEPVNIGNRSCPVEVPVGSLALNRSEEAIAVYDDVVHRFGDATEPVIREQVAGALFNKGVGLGALNRSKEAIMVYDEVLRRFGEATEPGTREGVAGALRNKGCRLGVLKRTEEALAVYDDMIRRFADATEPAIQDVVERAKADRDELRPPGAAASG